MACERVLACDPVEAGLQTGRRGTAWRPSSTDVTTTINAELAETAESFLYKDFRAISAGSALLVVICGRRRYPATFCVESSTHWRSPDAAL